MSATVPPRATGPAIRAGLGMASVALAILLLVGFKAPQDGVVMGAARTSGGSGATNAGGTSGGTSGSTGTGTTGSGSSGSGSSTSGTGKTYDGTLIQTRYGLVQVEITVKSGKVLTVAALELPVGGRSGAISSFVAPILSSEALSAQSSQIDIVSGATYTSDAYAQSLQAALDQAGI